MLPINPYAATEKPLESATLPGSTASTMRHWSLRIKDWMVIVLLLAAVVVIGLLITMILPIVL